MGKVLEYIYFFKTFPVRGTTLNLLNMKSGKIAQHSLDFIENNIKFMFADILPTLSWPDLKAGLSLVNQTFTYHTPKDNLFATHCCTKIIHEFIHHRKRIIFARMLAEVQ